METNMEPDVPSGASPSRRRSWIATAALATGLAVGAAGLAGAATGSDSTSSTDSGSTTESSAAADAQAPDGVRPDPSTMTNGPGETLLTGETAETVTAAALEAVPGGTIVRVETDSSGATYEAHMTKADGSSVTVLFDADFNVTSTEDGFGGGGPHGLAPPDASSDAEGTSSTSSN